MYAYFNQQTNEIAYKKTCTWLGKGNLKRETDKILRVNYFKVKIDNTQQNSKYRLCWEKNETVTHMKNECSNLAEKQYKTKHDWVWKVIHLELCKRLKFDHTKKGYMYKSKSLLQD